MPSRDEQIRGLWLERLAAEVCGGLRGAGVGHVLLKGPALERLLYGPEESRPYGDIDLLVSPAGLDRAEALLGALGFERGPGDEDFPGHAPLHGHHWERRGELPSIVDLHTTLPGIEAGREEALLELACNTGELVVAGTTVPVLDTPGAALHLALHAAHHGSDSGRPVIDLERGVAQLPVAVWSAAAERARRLHAAAAMGAGLRLTPAGRELAGQLELPAVLSIEQALKAASAPPLALALTRFSNAQGARRKLGIAVRSMAPTPAWLRSWSPLARRGRLGVALAYLGLPLWTAVHLPGALVAVARAGSAARAAGAETSSR